MLSVEEALRVILEDAGPLEAETVSIGELAGRVAADDVTARLTQPPFAASAMDGYAARFADAGEGARLDVIGEAPAGAPFAGVVGEGEAVRIFTGAVVPEGADHVVIQEDVTRTDDRIVIAARQPRAANIRPAGVDFSAGDRLASKGEVLHEIHGSIFAAANVARVRVVRRPRVAIFTNGDELIEPGAEPGPGQIINSNPYALEAMARAWGGAPDYLGRAPDEPALIAEFFDRARQADIVLPVGGASVGDHDYVKSAFRSAGGEICFEKVAVKPGKPTWFGRLGRARLVGLPGNPASAIVVAALFARPLIRALGGRSMGMQGAPAFETAILDEALPANGARAAFLRAEARDDAGLLRIRAAPDQDSSLLSPFASANALIRRPAEAPAASAGEAVEIVRLR